MWLKAISNFNAFRSKDVRLIFRILTKGKKGNLKAIWECERREREVVFKMKKIWKLISFCH